MNFAPAPATSAPTENLPRLVERVTFQNEENGFCVLRLKARGQRDLVTVVGHAATISAGEWVQAAGTWTNDRTHGLQFRANFLKATAPTTLDGIEKYLGSGMIRGIGPAYAKRLVTAFGEAVFDVIEADPSRLREVERIGPIRARRIAAGWAGQKLRSEDAHLCHATLRWRGWSLHTTGCDLHAFHRRLKADLSVGSQVPASMMSSLMTRFKTLVDATKPS